MAMSSSSFMFPQQQLRVPMYAPRAAYVAPAIDAVDSFASSDLGPVLPGPMGRVPGPGRMAFEAKTQMCRNWLLKGSCPNGRLCRFAHDSQLLSSAEDPPVVDSFSSDF